MSAEKVERQGDKSRREIKKRAIGTEAEADVRLLLEDEKSQLQLVLDTVD